MPLILLAPGAPEDLFNRFRDYVVNTWPGGFWNPNIGNQLGYGHQALLSEVSDDAIPATPTLSYPGDPSYPADGLTFEASEFCDPQGAETFAARQWRIAEISRNEAYEMEALWSAVTESAEATSVVYPISTVIPGRTYRARVRQRDDTGRWSHWSAPVTFVVSPAQSQLVHYWNFNQNGTPEDLLSPTVGSGSILIINGPSTEVLSGSGQDFAASNAQDGDPAGSHLRVNNPIGAIATFHIPTTHFSDVVVRFETRRSGQGAGEQFWSYTLDGEAWVTLSQVLPPDGEPTVAELDFRSIQEAGNNPHFAVRVQFSQGVGGEGGNNRIDNLTLTGKPMEGVNWPPVAAADIPERLDVIEGQSLTREAIASWFIDPEGDPLSFTASSSLPGVVSVSLEGDTLNFAGGMRGEALVTLTAEDGTNAPVEIEVRVLVHPAPHLLASSDFNFTDWSPDAPERSYPASMLFLQGNGNDSSLTTPLDRAYFIPHDDYSSDDDEIIGWPYKATARTRMNGLGNDGVSFINTGRGRDLGGALLALDTRGSKAVHLSFTSGTVKPNSRHYSIRLQYRIGVQGDFVDLTDGNGQPVEYNRHVTAGHSSEFPDIELPSGLLGRPYVQLLWRYYQSQDGSGARTELRLDDIQVSAETATYTYHEWRMLQYNDPETFADDTVSGPQAVHGPFETPNLQRYALGISLHEPVPPHLISITPEGQFRFRYNPEKSDVIWLVKTSVNLADWTTTLFDSRTDPSPAPGEEGWVDVPMPASGESRLFMRLELQLEDP